MNTHLPLSRRVLAALHPTGTLKTALSASIALLLPSFLHAQTWNGLGGDDNWGTGANWVGGVAPVPSISTDISFGGTTRLTPNNNYTAFDDFRNILFNSGAGAFTLNGSAIDLFGKIENNSTTAQTVNFAAIALNSATANEFDPTLGDLTINSADIFTNGNQLKIFGNNGKTLTFGALSNISGLGSVAINQNSNVIYQSGHTYSGDTFVNAGKLQFNTGASANNSTIRIGDTTGTAAAEVDLLPLTGGLTLSSVFNSRTGSSGTATIDSRNTSGTNTLSNQIALDKALTITETGAIGTGTLAITQARVGAGTTTGTDIKGFALTLNVTNLGNAITYSGDIYNSTGNGTVTKTGFGLLTLSGTNTYTGSTTITGGILRLGGSAAIANTGTIANIAAGALLDLNGTSETIGDITASPGSISLGSAALTLASNNASSITGLVYGTGGSLVKQGTNTLTLATVQGSSNSFSSGNLFSGGITHSAGTLTISTANAAGTGLITAASTLNISAAQLLNTGGITINGGTTTLSAIDSGGLGTVTLNTGGTLAITTISTGTRLSNVVLNGGTFTPFTSVQFGTLSGSQGFTTSATAGTLTFGGNNGTATYTGNIAGVNASAISKTGSGTQILNGTNATTGTITVNGSGGTLEIGGQYNGSTNVAVQSGTLKLNFGTNNTVTTDMVKSAALSLSGGTLSVVGQNTATNVVQNFTGTTTTAGTSSNVSVTNGSSTGTTAVNIGAIARGAGSVINFNLPSSPSATNGVLTSSGAAGILLGTGNQAYITVNGTDFAAKDAGNTFVQALTGTVNATGGASLTGTATDNANITGGNIAVAGASAINTVRFNDSAARTLTLGGALTVTQSGILVSSAVTAAGSSITGGSITSGTDVIIHQNSAQAFTLNSAVTGSGVILTKAGQGTLILTAGNSNSGLTYVTSGRLQIGAGGSVGGNSVLSLAPNDPTAVFDVNNQTTTVGNISGGGTTGGYITLGSTGTLNDISGFSSTYSGALVGGVGSTFNKSGGSQGIQGPNQAFFGTVNITGTGQLGVFGGGGFINSTVNVNSTATGFNQGSSGTTVAFGNIAGTTSTSTLIGASNASANSIYNFGYLGGNSSFAGIFANGTNATPGLTSLGKFGSGTTTLSGANTYTGTTTINSGGLTFDYATSVPLSTGALMVGGGTATFLGKASGATAISTGTFGVSNSVLSRVTVNANTGTGTTLTLQTATVNSIVTLGSTSVNNNVLFDLSSSGSNVLLTNAAIGAATASASDTIAIRTNNGLLTTGIGAAGITGYRANVLIRDSTGIGFAQASGSTISRYTSVTALTGADSATTLVETGAGNYRLSVNLTRGAGNQFLYNTLQLDSSTQAVTLTTDSNGNRFGGGVQTTSGRGVLATGTNGATITSIGGTNQATYFNNYQTGTTAGQTLTLNMPLAGSAYFNGTGLTVATGLVNSSDHYFQSGVTRLTGAQASGDALTAGGGAYRLVGGILEIGADLTGSASPTSTADFSRSVGSLAGQVQLLGDTGFSAFGGTRTVNLGGAGQQLVWGNDNFLASTAGNTTEGNNTFKLSSAFSDSTLDFQNPIALGSITRQVDVADGSAAVDARLSGVLSGVFAPTVTLSNSSPAIANAAAGLTKLGAGTLELTGANSYKGQTRVTAGTLRLNRATADNSAIPTDSNAATASDIVINGGTLEIAASEQIGNTASIVLTSGTFQFSGNNLTETIDTFTNSGGTFTTGTGTGNTLEGLGNTVTWSGGTNTITNGNTVKDKHWVVTGGTNTVNAGGKLVVNPNASIDGFYFGGTANPTITLDSSNGTAGQIILKDDVTVDSTLTSGTAQILSGGANTNAGFIDLFGAARTFTVNNGLAATDLLISASLQDSLTGGGVTKAGAGTMNLSGANTYAGATTVNAGTLSAGVASVANVSGAFGNNSAVTMANVAGATLNITGFNTQIGSLTGGGTTGGNVTLGAATLTTGGDNTSPAGYAGVISGTGGVTKIGTGTQTLAGANTYTGATLVSNGTLAVDNNGTTTLGKITGSSAANSITVNSTGTLLLGGTGSGDRIGDTTGVTLAGGTFSLQGVSNLQETAGLLTLSANSTLDFGTGNGNTLTFSGLSLGGFSLAVRGWTGPFYLPGQSDAGSIGDTQDRLLFTTLALTQSELAQISFYNDAGTFLATAQQISFGATPELVPVPEPTTILGALALLGLVGYRERRRLFGMRGGSVG